MHTCKICGRPTFSTRKVYLTVGDVDWRGIVVRIRGYYPVCYSCNTVPFSVTRPVRHVAVVR